MSLLVKVFVCQLVYLQIVSISCQQPWQQNNRTQTFFNDLRKFLHIPVPKRADTKQNQHSQTQPPTALSGSDLSRQQNSNWTPQINNINNDGDKFNPDCSDQIDLNCEEQKKLIDNIFRNNNPRSNSNINFSNRNGFDRNSDTASIFFNDMPETQKTDEIETTTDYGLDDRIAAEIVASFLG